MKKINGIVGILKLAIKYGAYIAVGIKVIQFAIDEFGKVETEKLQENEPEQS